ncbi:MAG: hypothetical protein P8170_08510 [Gemmatimonadota bacterium]
MLYQLVSVLGAALVLLAYGLSQAGRLRPTDVAYGLMNLIGASLLTWIAVVDRRLGFILLESVWAALSLLPLIRRKARLAVPDGCAPRRGRLG